MYPRKKPEETSVVVHEPVGTQVTSANVARTWRVERYLELGFTEVDSNLLADAKDSTVVKDRHGTPRTWKTPLHWMKAQKALTAGATHKEIMEWFT